MKMKLRLTMELASHRIGNVPLATFTDDDDIEKAKWLINKLDEFDSTNNNTDYIVIYKVKLPIGKTGIELAIILALEEVTSGVVHDEDELEVLHDEEEIARAEMAAIQHQA